MEATLVRHTNIHVIFCIYTLKKQLSPNLLFSQCMYIENKSFLNIILNIAEIFLNFSFKVNQNCSVATIFESQQQKSLITVKGCKDKYFLV